MHSILQYRKLVQKIQQSSPPKVKSSPITEKNPLLENVVQSYCYCTHGSLQLRHCLNYNRECNLGQPREMWMSWMIRVYFNKVPLIFEILILCSLISTGYEPAGDIVEGKVVGTNV